ncbi:TPA: IS256 family transposase [Enterococcus faecium]|uniref:IS256 family transposase n=1 Tax=Enterococcus faecium TaxID=1352 RepID=UPI00226EAF51|nr:IS256 family transposase [Enterococcus faecium]HBL1205311.1 IS256 family transposase [Enterococcus faecium]HBL1280437.1 IS256 family transposase [Enterococcus faecium]HBL1300744.1 IS256 family transposase [Enterococcus faecium]HBL1323830.1 IS256 family transposase [Enterococcus faecium]HBL1398726.1 IS256 family transposase [Enterococcus faecium]
MARKKRNPDAEKLAESILNAYQPESVDDMQDALKDVFGPLFEKMLQGELNNHLGYDAHSKEPKEHDNRRNGYGTKTLKTSFGEVAIDVPRDREASFEPELIPKRKRDVSDIEGKVLSMYARGMSQRDIAATVEAIYGFDISHEMISDITDAVLPELEEWQARPLAKCYAFLFVDCMYVTLRENYEAKEYAVYTILGYDLKGNKEILGLWLNQTESKNRWMQVFDELKARGVEDVFFISMDGVSGLEEGAKAIFPSVIVQRCIVHLVRNALRYIPSKDYKEVCRDMKKFYGASSLNAAHAAFDSFQNRWSHYSGAVDVWKRNFAHVEQLFDYGSAIRKIMYTTNAVESVHSSFRKVTKKGAFSNENALLKLLYLRTKELHAKWSVGRIQNWAMVLNQLMINETFSSRMKSMRFTFRNNGRFIQLCVRSKFI